MASSLVGCELVGWYAIQVHVVVELIGCGEIGSLVQLSTFSNRRGRRLDGTAARGHPEFAFGLRWELFHYIVSHPESSLTDDHSTLLFWRSSDPINHDRHRPEHYRQGNQGPRAEAQGPRQGNEGTFSRHVHRLPPPHHQHLFRCCLHFLQQGVSAKSVNSSWSVLLFRGSVSWSFRLVCCAVAHSTDCFHSSSLALPAHPTLFFVFCLLRSQGIIIFNAVTNYVPLTIHRRHRHQLVQQHFHHFIISSPTNKVPS